MHDLKCVILGSFQDEDIILKNIITQSFSVVRDDESNTNFNEKGKKCDEVKNRQICKSILEIQRHKFLDSSRLFSSPFYIGLKRTCGP